MLCPLWEGSSVRFPPIADIGSKTILPSGGSKAMHALLVSLIALASPSGGHATSPVAGVYLCTVAQKAGLARLHLEGAGDPSAFVEDKVPTRFKMQIRPDRKRPKRYRLVEIAYDGADRDPYEWEDENSVLHGTYSGDGRRFRAVDSPAFFVMARSPNEAGDFEFYHAGFEHPGGEETNLAVRWGRCRKAG